MRIPADIPEIGAFYYHYKHKPKNGVFDHAYEVVGVGIHTEGDCRPEDANMVVYRPLYKSAPSYTSGKFFYLRPLTMWIGQVEVAEMRVPRFSKISDLEVLEKLQKQKEGMYGK